MAKVNWYEDKIITQVNTALQKAMMQAVLMVEADAKRLCLHSKTKILTPKGWKPINKLKVGDLVTTKTSEFKPIEQIKKSKPNKVRKIYARGSKSNLVLSLNHLIHLNEEWKPAGQAKVGDTVSILAGRCKYCGGLAKYNIEFCSDSCKGKYNYEFGYSKEGLKKGQKNAKELAKKRDYDEMTKKYKKWVRTHPEAEKKRRKKQSKSLKKLYKEHPEKHPNAICANQDVSSLERKTGDLLDELGVDYVRQYNVDNRWIDIAIPKRKLFLECDGEYWHQDKEADRERDAYIMSLKPDWNIIHLEEHEIKELDAQGLKDYIDAGIGEINFVQIPITKIEERETHEDEAYYYDLVIDGGKGNYIAKGFLVHNCPVDTGRLRADITHEVEQITKDIIQGKVGVSVHYGKFVALGTSKQSAQPYLRPALEKNWPEIVRMIRGAL